MLNPRLLASHKGNYHRRIDIVEGGHERFMRFGATGGRQGAINLVDSKNIVISYQRVFAHLARSLLKVDKFLSLGVGTGTAIRTMVSEGLSKEVYGVEVDPVVVNLAIRYFDCPTFSAVNYTFGDGLQYLEHSRDKFDLIFVDEYTSNSIEETCLQPSFVRVLENALTHDGVAVCNIVSRYPFVGQAKKFLSEVKKIFPLIALVPLGDLPFTEQNVVVAFTKNDELLISWYCQFLSALSLDSLSRWFPLLRPRVISQSFVTV